MLFWLVVILASGLILLGLMSILWVLACGSNVKRRWILVGLLLNEEMNAPDESTSTSARERREAKKLFWEQQGHFHSEHHVHYSHYHGGSEGTGHHGSSHGGGFDNGGGFHSGGSHHG